MTVPIPWREMTHEQLHAAVNSGPGPGASMAAEQMWRRLSEVVAAGEQRMHAAVSAGTDGWEGAGAAAAHSGLHALNSWARDAATDAQNTVTAMIEQGVAAGRLRAGMPAPNTAQLDAARDDAATNLFDEGVQRGLLAVEADAAGRVESARRAMEGYHYHSMDNRRLMDYWTTPPSVVVEAASAQSAVPGGPAPGPGSGQPPAGLGAAAAPDGGAGAVGGATTPGTGTGAQAASGGVVGAAPAGSGGGPGTGRVVTGAAGGSGAGAQPGGGGVAAPGAGGVAAPAATGGARASGARASGARVAGGRVAGLGSGGVGGPGVAGSDRAAGAVPPVRGRADLPPGAGGRGPRPGPWAPHGDGGVRAVVPRVPSAGPSPTWRDLVAGQRGEHAASGGRAAESSAGPRGGSGGPVGAGPRPELRAGAAVSPESGRAAGGHGMYPPMGAGGGSQGEGRRRASFLVDDSGAFDVDVPHTDPVIGGHDRA